MLVYMVDGVRVRYCMCSCLFLKWSKQNLLVITVEEEPWNRIADLGGKYGQVIPVRESRTWREKST